MNSEFKPPALDRNRGAREGNEPLADAIVKWWNHEIDSERLCPGDKLPSESQQCAQFVVSRSVVREALSRLKSEGIISAQQGRGAFVNERTRQAFRLKGASIRDVEGVANVLDLLVALESATARYAAIRRNSDDLKRMRQALVGMEYAIVNDKPGEEEDFGFHQSIVDATRNPHFKTLNGYFEHYVRGFVRQARINKAGSYNNLIGAVHAEHNAIYQAIEAGEPGRAAVAAEAHLRNAVERLSLYPV